MVAKWCLSLGGIDSLDLDSRGPSWNNRRLLPLVAAVVAAVVFVLMFRQLRLRTEGLIALGAWLSALLSLAWWSLHI